ncbi:MAG: SpoIIE family protein phosphatase [Acidobacteriaceae bacterium]|nr:SpoIIE family protein phosphatase [Acidobacteriaceae bacterium]
MLTPAGASCSWAIIIDGTITADSSFPGAIIRSVNGHHSHNHAHRCSFLPGREDPYLRLGTVSVFVRDQDRSLRFFVDEIGFNLAIDHRLPSGDRWLTVIPPDGTAMIALIAPPPESEEYKLIGRSTHVVFLTEDVVAKFEEWRRRGIRFQSSPQPHCWGETSAVFEDPDGNSFTLLCCDELTLEVQEQRRAHAIKLESERRNNQELENARQVQARLFPQIQPAAATLEYAGLCIQARQVGGDYYDFLDLGRERLGLMIADVAGKGTPAALLMANLQAHLRNQCAIYWNRPFTPFALEQPQRVLAAVNRLFRENVTGAAYATLFFAEYNDRTRQLRYANCGHPPAILVRSDESIERLNSTTTVVGLFNQWECAVGELQLSPGDTLALYTDGLTESFNAEGEEFGEERLLEKLRQCRELSSSNLLASLVDEVRRFSPHEQHDDITLIVARCKGE